MSLKVEHNGACEAVETLASLKPEHDLLSIVDSAVFESRNCISRYTSVTEFPGLATNRVGEVRSARHPLTSLWRVFVYTACQDDMSNKSLQTKAVSPSLRRKE